MVDIDEADIAVLNKNLIRSKDLFNSITQSLNKISNKSNNALTKIKPILKDVNKLTNDNIQIDKGLEKLREVSGYAERTSNYEAILNNSIDVIGIKRYIETLNKLKLLLVEMKTNIKKFYGILINFENLIDKLEFNLMNYFRQQLTNNKFNDIMIIFKYFKNDNKQVNKILVDSRSSKMVDKMRAIEQQREFKPKNNPNPKAPPYERGSNGLNQYVNELQSLLTKEYEILNKLQSERLFNLIINHTMNNFNKLLQDNYLNQFNDLELINNDLLILEIIELLVKFENFINKLDNIKNYELNLTIQKLMINFKNLLKENFKLIEYKIQNIEKMNELNSTGILVDLITKIRKQCDFILGLEKLIGFYKIGEWLNIKPSLRFISVYTSVIKTDDSLSNGNKELSNYTSDLIDCIMINLEISLKSEFKKLSQGYYLIKNLILVETIINRSENVFKILGSIGMERINKLKKRFLNYFLEDWNHASYLIIKEMTEINTVIATNQLKDKEKDLIRKLFEKFNESFEEAIKNYEKFNITDPNLKNYLNSEIKKLILNAYFKLYDKYGNFDLKHRGKYIKYNKMEFENTLNERLGK